MGSWKLRGPVFLAALSGRVRDYSPSRLSPMDRDVSRVVGDDESAAGGEEWTRYQNAVT